MKFQQMVSSSAIDLRHFAQGLLAHCYYGHGQQGHPPRDEQEKYLMEQWQQWPVNTQWPEVLKQLRKKPEQRAQQDWPVWLLADQLELTDIEIVTAVLLLLVEENYSVGAAVEYLQKPHAIARPTLGFLQVYLKPFVDDHWLPGLLINSTAMKLGLIEQVVSDQPLAQQVLRMQPDLVSTLNQLQISWPEQWHYGENNPLTLPERWQQDAENRARLLEATDSKYVIYGNDALLMRKLADCMIKSLDLDPLCLEANAPRQGLLPLSLINRRCPVFMVDNQSQLDAIDYPGRHVVLALMAPVYRQGWRIERLDFIDRQHIWMELVNDEALAFRLAAERRFASMDQMQNWVDLAYQQSHDEALSWQGIRNVTMPRKNALPETVSLLSPRVEDGALVLSSELWRGLHRVHSHCLQISDPKWAGWGTTLRSQSVSGVNVLFMGPPGAGKTFSASWLASQLGLPLYRVNVGALMATDQAIETLNKLEYRDAVLLLDEADQLLSSQSAVADHLLQRMEDYAGILVFIAREDRVELDASWMQRLHHVLRFTWPTAQQRREIWQSHLGSEHQLSAEQLDLLAHVCDLSGAHIRHTVMAALSRVWGQDYPKVSARDVVMALDQEYDKLGRRTPMELRPWLEQEADQ